MDNDDLPVGRVLTRREALALFGTLGVAALAACAPGVQATATQNAEAQTAEAIAANPTAIVAGKTAVPACVVIPELTEGPYFVDGQLERADIRSDPTTSEVKEGTPLALTFNVSQISGGACTPLAGAMVDVWHCDAAGSYSGVSDPGFDTAGEKWLRGYLVTGADGVAAFTTIYPGWYSGRTVHIHFKIRTTGSDSQTYEFTSQLFFDEAVTAQVFAQAPYNTKGQQDTSNASDGIYQDETLLRPTEAGGSYQAVLAIALDLSDAEVGAADSGGGPGGGGPGGGGPPPGGSPTP